LGKYQICEAEVTDVELERCFVCGRLCCADCIATEELCIECYEEEETAEEDLFQ